MITFALSIRGDDFDNFTKSNQSLVSHVEEFTMLATKHIIPLMIQTYLQNKITLAPSRFMYSITTT